MPYSLSYWEKESFFQEVDVAIIGSGIVGLNAAIHLRSLDQGLKVIVLEQGALPTGASTRNAGFACFGSLSELLDDLETLKEEAVWDLVEKRWKGFQELKALIGNEAMGYRKWGGFELFKPEEKIRYERCLDKIPHFNKNMERITGINTFFQVKDDLITAFGLGQTAHLVLHKGEGQIHTGQMMKSLLAKARYMGVEIYNGVSVQEVIPEANGVRLATKEGWSINAAKVLIATNGFVPRLLPELHVQPARNQVLITEPVKGLRFKGCFHYDRGYYYFRNIDGRVLLGGGRNLAKENETTDKFGTTELIQQALIKMLKDVILPGQDFRIAHWWSGILGVGVHKTPIVKKMGERVTVAVRLGGMGVAIGTLVGREGAECLIKG